MFKKQKWNLIGLALSSAIILVFIYIARYALPNTDDFAYALEGRNHLLAAGGSIPKAIWTEFVYVYNDHQGSYLALMSSFLFFHLFGLNMTFFRLAIAGIVALFFFGILRLMRSISKATDLRYIWALIAFLTIWLGVNLASPSEALYYMCGACTYALPLGISFLAIAHFIDYMRSGKLLHAILASVFGFLGAGGVLICGGFLNIVMLSILVLSSIYHHRFAVKQWISWFITLAGSLLNALAPGHLNRHTAYESSGALNIVSTLQNTFLISVEFIVRMFTQNYFLLIMVLLAILIFAVAPRPNKEHFVFHPVWMILISFLTIFTSLFPVVLGYGSKLGDNSIELRIQFAISIITAIALISAWIYLLAYIRANTEWKLIQTRAATILALLVTLTVGVGTIYQVEFSHPDQRSTITTMISEITTHNLEKAFLSTYYVYLQAEKLPEGGACVAYSTIIESPILPKPNLSSDPNWWVDYAIREYYHLGHFSYSPKDELSLEELRYVVSTLHAQP